MCQHGRGSFDTMFKLFEFSKAALGDTVDSYLFVLLLAFHLPFINLHAPMFCTSQLGDPLTF